MHSKHCNKGHGAPSAPAGGCAGRHQAIVRAGHIRVPDPAEEQEQSARADTRVDRLVECNARVRPVTQTPKIDFVNTFRILFIRRKGLTVVGG